MHKIKLGKRKIILYIVFSVLAGCQTAGQVGNMSRAGMNALSCEQIDAAFSAYEQDRNSVDAWVQLVQLVNPEIDAYAYAKSLNKAELYSEAKAYTDLALAVKGCRPL